MKTILKVIAGVIVLVVLGVGIFVATFDVDRYKPEIQAAVKKATGRDLTIEGKLSLSIFPTTALAVDRVRFANAPGAGGGDMATIGSFKIAVQPLPLITSKQLIVDAVSLSDVAILLAVDKNGRGNWVFDTKPADAGQPKADAGGGAAGGQMALPKIGRVDLARIKLTWSDARSGAKKTVDIDELNLRPEGELIALKLAAKINGAPIEAAGQVGGIETILAGTKPLPVKLTVSGGGAKAAVDGSLANLNTLVTLDMAVSAEGQNLADLSTLAGTALPKSKPFKVSAALKGNPASELKIGGLNASLGATALAGDLTVKLGGARPAIAGKLSSPSIDTAEIEGAIGDAPAAAPAKAAAPPAKPDGRLIPDTPLPLDGLGAADLDLTLAVASVKTPALVLSDVDSRVQLNDSLLTVRPFNATFAGRPVALDLSANGKVNQIALRLNAKALPLGDILRERFDVDKLKGGPTDVNIDVSGTGKTLRALAAGLNGNIGLGVHEGTIAASYGDIVGDTTAKVLQLEDSRGAQTKLTCAVARFDVKSGLATSRTLTVDTGRLTVQGNGTLNFGTEAIALKLTPTQIAVPVDVGGTFAHPTFAADAKAIAQTAVTGAIAGAASGGGAAGALSGALGSILPGGGGKTSGGTPTKAGDGGNVCATAFAAVDGKAPPAQPAAQPAPAQKQQPAPAQKAQPSNPAGALGNTLRGILKQ